MNIIPMQWRNVPEFSVILGRNGKPIELDAIHQWPGQTEVFLPNGQSHYVDPDGWIPVVWQSFAEVITLLAVTFGKLEFLKVEADS